MRFLIDANLSPTLAEVLNEAGHEAVHVADALSLDAPDHEILDHAAAEARVVVSSDTDFGDLLASREAASPSVILFRRQTRRRAREQAVVLLAHLPVVAEDLEQGSVVIIEEARLRVRRLPIDG